MAQLVTVGTGEVERIADQADLRLSWVGRGKDRNSAVTQLTGTIKDVEPHFDRSGVRVVSRRLSVHDVWSGKRREGAEASQSYLVRITDVTVLDDLLAVLVGSEPAAIDGPTWALADDTEPAREAQQKAVADARAKAEGYADAVDGRLGALVQVTDGSMSPHQPMFAAAYSSRSGGAALPNIADLGLEPQPVTVSAQCTITWELLV